jgi:rod shape determining protein RodA
MRRSSLILDKLSEINWHIVGLMLAIAAIGFVMMASAGNGHFFPFASQQISRFLFAFVLMLVIASLPMRLLVDYAYLIYGACVVVLIGVDIVGHIGMGAQRWIKLGGMNIQPSEFMKLAMVLALARYFHRLYPEDIQRLPYLIPPLLIMAIPAVLILRQPNLGTALITLGVGGTLCLLAGVQLRYFIGAGLSAIIAAPFAWHYMHDYQKRRVLTFLDPQSDPLGAGYNILQSMIAIGSGGFFGKGFLKGSQSQLDFLPEKQTDFVFTMIGEEFGFLGGILMLGLFFMLLSAGMAIAMNSRSTFGGLVAGGITIMLFFHVLINCGMVMGMLPVVGVPLPLVSYGGSNMVASVLAIGLLLNACANQSQLPGRHTLKT